MVVKTETFSEQFRIINKTIRIRMKKILTVLFLFAVSFCFAFDFSDGVTSVETENNTIIVITTNFQLANSFQNNSNILEYISYENGEIGKTEYIFVFKNDALSSSFITYQINLHPATSDISAKK